MTDLEPQLLPLPEAPQKDVVAEEEQERGMSCLKDDVVEDEEKGLDGFRWWKGEPLLPLDEEVAIYRSSSQLKNQ